VAVDGPEFHPLGAGRYKAEQQPDASESGEDPAVAAILPDARADVSAREERRDADREHHDRERNACRVREEGTKSAPTQHGEADIGGRADDGDHKSQDWRHWLRAFANDRGSMVAGASDQRNGRVPSNSA